MEVLILKQYCPTAPKFFLLNTVLLPAQTSGSEQSGAPTANSLICEIRTHLDFILAAANLGVFMAGIPPPGNVAKILPIIETVIAAAFKPRTGVRTEVTEAKTQAMSTFWMSEAFRVEEICAAVSNVDVAKLNLTVV